jgi:hypothetical protein
MMAKCLCDSYAAPGSSASMMEMTKATSASTNLRSRKVECSSKALNILPLYKKKNQNAAYNQGKNGNSPVGCQPKEGYLIQKTQASRGVVIFVACLALFAYLPLARHSETANLT